MQYNSTSKNKTESRYKDLLNQYLMSGSESIFLYWKGRVALYAILRAMGVGEGDEVIIQGYTCVVVVNAVIYLGAKPIYVDIDQHTFNINLDNLKNKVTNNTKVIICQDTYGLSSNLEEIQKIASKKGIYTVEDCTHGFGGSYHGIPNGTSCDASFFSTQWNKPFSTGIGGFAVIHNSSLLNKMKEQEQDKIFPNFKDRVELKMMYFIREYLVNDFTYWFMVSLYRWLSRHNLVVGSSSGEEVTGTEMPDNYFKAMSVTQMKKGIKSIQKLNEVNKIRKKNATEYTHFLMTKSKNHVNKHLFSDHIFLKYPLLVENREEFKKKAEKNRIILGEWFEAPVYPYSGSLKLWGVDEKDIPVAMYVSKHVVNLPTDIEEVNKVIDFLKRELLLIKDEE